MVGLVIRFDKKAVSSMLHSLPRSEIPFTTALALTRTAQSAKAAQVAEMKRAFQSPTHYTLNALRIAPATKQSLTATVAFKEGGAGTPAGKYLLPEVEGGARRQKGMEVFLRAKGILQPNQFIIPGRHARIDANGNIARGMLNQIFNGLGARSASRGTKRKRSARSTSGIFVMVDRRLRPNGVARRLGRSGIQILLAFVRQPTYRKRFRFYEVGQAHADKTLPVEFERAFNHVMQQRGFA